MPNGHTSGLTQVHQVRNRHLRYKLIRSERIIPGEKQAYQARRKYIRLEANISGQKRIYQVKLYHTRSATKTSDQHKQSLSETNIPRQIQTPKIRNRHIRVNSGISGKNQRVKHKQSPTDVRDKHIGRVVTNTRGQKQTKQVRDK